MQLNPARGRKHFLSAGNKMSLKKWFMQLNPARGRKLTQCSFVMACYSIHGLCSSTPRGDGNNSNINSNMDSNTSRFMQLNPARGRKRQECAYGQGVREQRFMQLNPARGRKHDPNLDVPAVSKCEVYAAQPREGTETKKDKPRGAQHIKVYAAQPREGTETLP